jgi:uncharacterized protein (DUF934 family)
MRVIKDKKIVDDEWSVIRDLDDAAPVPDGDVILPFHYWQANRETLLKQASKHAVWINGDTDVEDLISDLEHFSMIALDFPVFKDGRCYSHARLLKDRYDYKGDLRAIGDVLRDQLFFMHRCGIDSFQIREDKDAEDALNAFNDFTVRYQAAADDAVPIYKLR